jgi:hypothetical protein
MREIVADNRVNPNTTAIPASPTEWSHHRQAVWEEEQRQKIAERAAVAAELAAERAAARTA